MRASSQKYTLSLPKVIYEELKGIARERDTSIKEVVRQCLKFGLVAIKIDADPDAEIIIRRYARSGGQDGGDSSEPPQDTLLQFIW